MKKLISLVLVLLAGTGGVAAGAGNPQQRAAVARAVNASVVVFEIGAPAPHCGGVLIETARVLTNFHCLRVAGLSIQTVTGERISAMVVKSSRGRDLALLRLGRPVLGPTASLSTDVDIGDTVYTVGSPSGEPFVVSQGIVAKVIPNLYFTDSTGLGVTPQHYILLSAVAFFGNSGGGVFDERGNWVGITVRLYVATREGNPPVRQVLGAYVIAPQAIRQFLEE